MPEIIAHLMPVAKQRFFDTNGDPLVGGKLYSYAAGTTTPLATYSNKDGASNTNPIILDANGECDVWVQPGMSYKFVLTDSADVTQWTVDKVNTVDVSDAVTELEAQLVTYVAAAEAAQLAAETAETNAETAETNAETAQGLAEAAQAAAEAAQIAAETAQTNAETAETNAETAETNAAASAVTAAGLAAGLDTMFGSTRISPVQVSVPETGVTNITGMVFSSPVKSGLVWYYMVRKNDSVEKVQQGLFHFGIKSDGNYYGWMSQTSDDASCTLQITTAGQVQVNPSSLTGTYDTDNSWIRAAAIVL